MSQIEYSTTPQFAYLHTVQEYAYLRAAAIYCSTISTLIINNELLNYIRHWCSYGVLQWVSEPPRRLNSQGYFSHRHKVIIVAKSLPLELQPTIVHCEGVLLWYSHESRALTRGHMQPDQSQTRVKVVSPNYNLTNQFLTETTVKLSHTSEIDCCWILLNLHAAKIVEQL